MIQTLGQQGNTSSKYCYKIVEDPNNTEFPVHPDKVSKIPNWTDRKLGGFPVLYLYGAVFGFCAVYIFGGLLGALMHLSMEYMHYFSVIGLVVGFLIGKFIVEPMVLVSFEQATHEQQARAVQDLLLFLEEESE